MRITALTACLASATLSLCAHAGALYDGVDASTGLRTVAWATVAASPKRFSFNVSALIPQGGTASYVAELLTWSDSNRFKQCQSIDWLLDGKKDGSLQTEYKSSYQKNAVFEHFILRPDRQTLQRFASAKQVEYRICDERGAVSSQALDGLREVLAATR